MSDSRKANIKVKELIRMLQNVNGDAYVFRGDSEHGLFPVEYIHIPDELYQSYVADYMHPSIPAVIIE
jgi:hypothetical protein